MDQPEPLRPTEPSTAEPQPSEAEPQPSFVIPTAAELPPSDEELLIDIFSPWLILTVARARILLRLLLRLLLRPQP